jgi:uncharacterized protein (TIGR02444 family)
MTERSEFVEFALGLYGADGVSAACLSLQDRCAVDVNLVLFAAYLGTRRGRNISSVDVDRAAGRVQRWNREVVAPLRDLRNSLRDGPPPAPTEDTEALRQQVKDAELRAEMLELAELATLVDDIGTADGGGGAVERATAAIEVVLRVTGTPGPDRREADAVGVIASAAARYGAA